MCKYCNRGIHRLFENESIAVQMVNNGEDTYCEIEHTTDFDDAYTTTKNDFFDIDYCPKCGRKF